MSEAFFSIEEFQRIKAKLKPYSLPVVGIVCKPSLELIIRQGIIEQSHGHFSVGNLVGMPIFTDPYQCADILTFTDEQMLRAYLQRHEKPEKWATAMMRGLMKDRKQARKYGIPFKLPPVVDVSF